MPIMPPTFRPPTQRTKLERARESDSRRGSARERGYTTAWDKAARGHLRSHPLCRYCELGGQTVKADLVDHLYPHKGEQWLFWFKPFWIACCEPCHNRFKQRIERAGLIALDTLAEQLGLPSLAVARRSGGGGG